MLMNLETLMERHNIPVIQSVIHVGAHTCEELEVYEQCGIKSVEWYEANKDLESKMLAATKGSNIECGYIIGVALSDKQERSKFYVTDNYASSSILPLKEHLKQHPNIGVMEEKTVHTERLDKITGFDSEYQPLLMNLDVQGAELKVLKGATETLKITDYIYTEVNIKELYEGCAKLNEMDAFLGEYGFKRVDVKMTKRGWGDAFYVKK